MWTCIHCGIEVTIQPVQTDVVKGGSFFICPECGGRNKLFEIAKNGDKNIFLAQLADLE